MKILSRNKWIALLLLVCVVGAGFFWQKNSSSSKGTPGKRYGKVKRGDLIQRVTVSGQIKPQRRTVFVAPYAGYINKIYVTVGQKVKENDPIISIKSSLQSPEPVYPIRAPFSGTVVDVPKMEGEYVSEKDAKDILVRIDDLDKYFVVARAPELDATRIKKDMEVEVRVNALNSPPLKGIVRNITLAAADADGWRAQQSTFEVKVEVINPPAEIRSGQSAILDIVINKFVDVLYLEHEFIYDEAGKYYVITKRGKQQPIEIGRQSDVAVEIKGGISETDEVEQIDFLKVIESGK